MSEGVGPLALHGGGEFVRDEAFLSALLEAAGRRRGRAPADTLRVVMVPTAAAQHRPALAAATGAAAVERVAAEMRRHVRVEEARVIDEASAAAGRCLELLAAADLVYLPGGDPGMVLDVLGGSAALRAIQQARLGGAVVAGASAGAMAFGRRTWTPDGIRDGFGWAGDLLVLPHATPDRVAGAPAERLRLLGDDSTGILLLAERTGVIAADRGTWRVAGPGDVHWLAPRARAPIRGVEGEVLRLV